MSYLLTLTHHFCVSSPGQAIQRPATRSLMRRLTGARRRRRDDARSPRRERWRSHEPELVIAERSPDRAASTQHGEGAAVRANEHAHAVDDAVVDQQSGGREAYLGVEYRARPSTPSGR